MITSKESSYLVALCSFQILLKITFNVSCLQTVSFFILILNSVHLQFQSRIFAVLLCIRTYVQESFLVFRIYWTILSFTPVEQQFSTLMTVLVLFRVLVRYWDIPLVSLRTSFQSLIRDKRFVSHRSTFTRLLSTD